MSQFWIGNSGALCVDEKLHIHSLVRQDFVIEHEFSDMHFAISDDKGRVLVLDEDFSDVKSKRAFLGAGYKIADETFSAKISANVVTPFGFGKDAHIPAAAFSFKIKNTSKKKRTYMFGALVENFLRDTLQERVETDCGCGLHMSSATNLSVQPDYMTHCMLTDYTAEIVRYLEREDAYSCFIDQLACGEFKDMAYGVPAQKDCAAIYCPIELESGESKTLRMVYAWYMPNVCRFENDSAVFLKNKYLEGFEDSIDIAEYVLKEWVRLVGFSQQCTKAVRANLDSRTFEQAVWDNMQIAHTSALCAYTEPGASDLFLKNCYGTKTFYVQKFESLFPASVYFDFETEVQALSWAMQHILEQDGQFNGFPCENINEQSIEQKILTHFSPIWRIYRLYVLSGDVCYISQFWAHTERLLEYVTKAGWVRKGEAVVGLPNEEGVLYNFLLTAAYLLSLLCMQKMALLLDETEKATEYAKLASEGQAFVQRNFFNGQFYNEFYPMEGASARCSCMQIFLLQIGKILGLDVVDCGQMEIALENIYVLNYVGDEESGIHGVKLYSDEDGFDIGTEILYADALLRTNKAYLASLVCKARYVRESESNMSASECMLINALSVDRYDAIERCLYIGNDGLLCFAKNAFICSEGEKTKIVRVYGDSVKIDSLSYTGKGKISRVFYGEMELLFVRDGDRIHLNAPLVLSEGEELKIKM